MRALFFLMLILSFSFAQNVTYFLNVSSGVLCPDDRLVMEAIASNGHSVPGIELRLVLHSPYQGLRAVQTTDSKGQASAILTKPGEYRIYISTDDYNHPQYVTFNYPEMCPEPPPKSFNLSVFPDCNNSLLIISANESGIPLEDVFIKTLNWSSFSGPSGSVAFPLEEGYAYIQANKSGYDKYAFWFNVSCAPPEPPKPPPECLENSSCAQNQYCANETCMNLTGSCGYPDNHSWIDYECCDDNGCGYKMVCVNNSCAIEPAPEPNITENLSENESAEPIVEKEPEQVPLWAVALGLIALIVIAFLVLKKK
jgi:hypothetical protein